MKENKLLRFKITYIVFLFFIFNIFSLETDLIAQIKLNVKVSASNLFRWGSGVQNSVTGDTEKDYLEEVGDVRLFVNDFLFGVRFEYDSPIEFGKSTKGISRRFFEFQKEGFTVRAGNFYELFGKGLVLNAFENRGLGFNTQLDGLKVNYQKSLGKQIKVNATVLAGDMKYDDFIDTTRVENYKIKAANFNFSPIKYFTIGGSYLFAGGTVPTAGIFTNFTAELFEASLKFNYGLVDLYGSYSRKVTIIEPNQLYKTSAPKGDGGYASLTLTRPGIGVTLEYKNYRFNIETPNEKSATYPSKILPFQVPPSCIKEYSSTLLSRYPHAVDFDDEVGFGVDAFYSPSDNLTLNFNASLSSTHYEYIDVDPSANTKFERVKRDISFLPSARDAFSPYWEIFLEGEWYVKKNLKVKLAAGRQVSVLYNRVDPTNSDITRAFTVPIEVKFDFAKIYSLKINTEFQHVYNSIRSDDKNFISDYTSFSLSRSPNIVLTANFEITNDNEDPSGKKAWGSGEITYKFSSANMLTLSYGSERGGLKCSSGICRYVQPFNGFRLTLINNFN
jgi:hypothetical protein